MGLTAVVPADRLERPAAPFRPAPVAGAEEVPLPAGAAAPLPVGGFQPARGPSTLARGDGRRARRLIRRCRAQDAFSGAGRLRSSSVAAAAAVPHGGTEGGGRQGGRLDRTPETKALHARGTRTCDGAARDW